MHVRNAQRPRGWPAPSRRRTWSSTCSASTARTSPAYRWRSAARGSRGSALGGTWQVPAVYDDGPMLFEATLAAGSRGHGQQAPHVDVPFDRRIDGLAASSRTGSTRSFVVGGWRPQEGSSGRLGRACWSGSRRPTGCSTAAGSAAGSAGKASASCSRAAARSRRDDSPFDDEVPSVDAHGHALGRAVRRHRRRQPRDRRATSGCGSRPTAACAADLSPEDLLRREPEGVAPRCASTSRAAPSS